MAEEPRVILFGASRRNRSERDGDPDVAYPPEWVHHEGRLYLISLLQVHLEFRSMFGTTLKLQAREVDTTSLAQRE
jgi:hypothetical protein